eukprot:15462588-Alexandrium_andersonii.AAC.1
MITIVILIIPKGDSAPRTAREASPAPNAYLQSALADFAVGAQCDISPPLGEERKKPLETVKAGGGGPNKVLLSTRCCAFETAR